MAKKTTKKENKKTLKSGIKNLQTLFDDYMDDDNYNHSSENNIDKSTIKVVPTGILAIDSITNGGLPVGKIIQVVGRTGCGKSSLVANMLAGIQTNLNGKVIFIYCDSENTSTKERMENMGLMNVTPKWKLTIERFWKQIDGIIQMKNKNIIDKEVPVFIVQDSLNDMPCDKIKTLDDPDKAVGLEAKIRNFFIKKYVSELSEYNITIIYVNQYRDKIEMGGIFNKKMDRVKGLAGGVTLSGGHQVHYNTFLLLTIHDGADIDEKKYGFRGKKVVIEAVKNKNFIPKIKVDAIFNYVTGFKNIWTNFALLADSGTIVTKGSWRYLKGYKKGFYEKEASNLYETNAEFKMAFDAAIKEHFASFVHEYKNKYLDGSVKVDMSDVDDGLDADIMSELEDSIPDSVKNSLNLED